MAKMCSEAKPSQTLAVPRQKKIAISPAIKRTLSINYLT
ncbi:MAG: hypothetical protein OFPII_38890 [Osedax symbiont Rs1]|nr:MAG: hypothetical protein OFPII_38890 [Osedax symbiont Rs1]